MNNKVGLNLLSNEILLIIFNNLYAIDLYQLIFVNVRFNELVMGNYFVYEFPKEYKEAMGKIIHRFWGSTSIPFEELNVQSVLSFDEDALDESHDLYSISKSGRMILYKTNIFSSITFRSTEYLNLFKQYFTLLLPHVLPYILIHETNLNTRFHSLVMKMAVSVRATDGLVGSNKPDHHHFAFPNIFSFYVSQIIYCLCDKIVCLVENKNSLQSLNTDVNLYHRALVRRMQGCYVVHQPRILIFDALSSINFEEFQKSLNLSDRTYLK